MLLCFQSQKKTDANNFDTGFESNSAGSPDQDSEWGCQLKPNCQAKLEASDSVQKFKGLLPWTKSTFKTEFDNPVSKCK